MKIWLRQYVWGTFFIIGANIFYAIQGGLIVLDKWVGGWITQSSFQ